MKGYEDSIVGRYLPPGKSGNRLMIYDFLWMGLMKTVMVSLMMMRMGKRDSGPQVSVYRRVH